MAPPVFKTGERCTAALAGSIPVRLRHLLRTPESGGEPQLRSNPAGCTDQGEFEAARQDIAEVCQRLVSAETLGKRPNYPADPHRASTPQRRWPVLVWLAAARPMVMSDLRMITSFQSVGR